MKYLATIFLFLCVVIPTYAQLWNPCHFGMTVMGGTYSCETYDDWVLVFEDSFNGQSIDGTVWEDDDDVHNRFCNSSEAQYYTDGDNLSVSNGILSIIAEEESITAKTVDWIDEDEDLECNGTIVGKNEETFLFKSGQILSKPKFIHGKFEIRCKIPSIELLWPAFWLYGECGQEIDVFEFLDESTNPSIASKKVKFNYFRDIVCGNGTSNCDYDYTASTNMSSNMHTYSVEWDEHKLIWRVDGVTIRERYRFYEPTYGNPKTLCGNTDNEVWVQDLIYPKNDIPMKIIANLAVKDNSPADFPAELEIDYIRVYQRINSTNTVNICSESDILGATVAGQDIIVGGSTCSSITIEDGEFLYLVAKNSVTLSSSFEVEAGAIFSMSIDD